MSFGVFLELIRIINTDHVVIKKCLLHTTNSRCQLVQNERKIKNHFVFGPYLTKLSIMVSMLACPRCSELPSVWLSNRFFMMAIVCSTNWVFASVMGT